MMTNKLRCPGTDIQITVYECPQCGEEVELFTGESKVKCSKCGTTVFRKKASCVDWCQYAESCYGVKNDT